MIEHLLGKVHCGDNLTEIKKLPDNCVDSVVTDPPYGLQFMGKHWDYNVPQVETWREVLRVLKPGGYLLSFGGSRTFHRIAVNIEDAGFEIRDTIFWCYASGFPKSLNIAKAISAKELTGGSSPKNLRQARQGENYKPTGQIDYAKGRMFSSEIQNDNTKTELTENAQQWEGWGTALKPAVEPICVARKPASEDTIAANVIKWGTGAINIDGCRVGDEARHNPSCKTDGGPAQVLTVGRETVGRWPANLIHDGSPEVLQAFPNAPGQQFATGPQYGAKDSVNCYGSFAEVKEHNPRGDSGSAARFFYTAKASKWDRNEDCEGLEEKELKAYGDFTRTEEHASKQNIKSKNYHPTVKPTDLMQYLCRLVTPPMG